MFNHFRSEITKLELIPSSGGAFEVTVNGIKVYSKLETGSFPETEEIFEKMENF
nr:SelT/SelW/SelH family protein [Anaerobacillus isosaccharinicus]QOY34789.1 Rdx family protein [Anaerobacillus isosaccharinicus]